MTHFARLQLIGRITYYVGWIALVFGGMSHFSKIAKVLLDKISLS